MERSIFVYHDEKPLVSVVMPSFNNDLTYMKLSVESILTQNYPHFELIIVDDGNNEECLDYLRKLNTNLENVTVIFNSKRQGIAKSLNQGLESAKGKYVMRADLDDIDIAQRMRRQVEYLEQHPDVDILGSKVAIIDKEGNLTGTWHVKEQHQDLRNEVYMHCPMCHPSVMYRKEKILAIGGYDKNFRFSEDYELWTRAFKKGLKFYNLQEELHQYRLAESPFNRRALQGYKANVRLKWKNKLFNIGWCKGFLSSLVVLTLYQVAPSLTGYLRRKFYSIEGSWQTDEKLI